MTHQIHIFFINKYKFNLSALNDPSKSVSVSNMPKIQKEGFVPKISWL